MSTHVSIWYYRRFIRVCSWGGLCTSQIKYISLFFSAATNVPNANECIIVSMRLVVASFKKRTIKQRFPIICATVFFIPLCGQLADDDWRFVYNAAIAHAIGCSNGSIFPSSQPCYPPLGIKINCTAEGRGVEDSFQHSDSKQHTTTHHISSTHRLKPVIQQPKCTSACICMHAQCTSRLWKSHPTNLILAS